MCVALLGNNSGAQRENEYSSAVGISVNITLQFSQERKAAECENNLVETCRVWYKNGKELVRVMVNKT
jgi:hypothetical protein